MLSVNDSKIEHRKLILLARFGAGFVQNELIPEIEEYSLKYKVGTPLINEFQKNRLSQNSMYFHHSYAYADIPVGQEYDVIARFDRGKIQPDSVMECKTKVLHFFSQYRISLLEYANHGHHENCLIQFKNGIPAMIYELYEINEKKPMDVGQELCLCSYETLLAAMGKSACTHGTN